LIIVESPNKIKTLKKFLGDDYEIKSSLGHIMNLPKKKLGVDVNNEFMPEYITEQGKDKVIRELKKAMKKVDQVYLAPDPDREGEAISWHLSRILELTEDSLCRITFNSITKNEVLKSLESPRQINMSLVNAQQSRRILDRLVGYKLSPLLWEKIHKGLSAGRVQSVAMLLISAREEEICRFKPEEYWNITAAFKDPSGDREDLLRARLMRKGKSKISITNGDEARSIEEALSKNDFVVSDIDTKTIQRSPQPPFITSTLQQVAAKNLGFSVRKTMMIAQQLYEGIEIASEGPVGLITYMRTDSTRTANEALDEVRSYIDSTFGKEFVPSAPRSFTKKKLVQDAHECIRPTSLRYTPENLAPFLAPDQLKLYTFIFNRFVASQMAPADVTNCTVEVSNGVYIFTLKGTRIDFDGYLRIYNVQDSDEDEGGTIPGFVKGQVLIPQNIDLKQSFTQPPPRFTEGTLVKELEKNGVGRPSTYAVIISTILKREYVRLVKKQFIPTELGLIVNQILKNSFSAIINVEFTANLEKALDDIAEGRSDWHEILKTFYESFEKILSGAIIPKISLATDLKCPSCEKEMVLKFANKNRFFACSGFPGCKTIINISEDATFNQELIDSDYTLVAVQERIGSVEAKRPDKSEKAEVSDKVCDKCGGPMVIREGSNGKFLGCQAFPKCRNTMPMDNQEDQNIPEEDKNCEKCNSPMVVRHSRKGRFLACSAYPKCKHTKSLPLNIGCPKENCEGQIVVRRGRNGKTFYGCSRYPDCDFTSWKRPE
jgi:DNA topoisomerase-1